MPSLRLYDSPLGGIVLLGDGRALTGLYFEGQKGCPGLSGGACEEEDLPVFDETARWLDLYFSGKAPDFTPPLRPEGSAFRRAVWAMLLTIPYGQTRSYGELARAMAAQRGGERISARAVGGAVGANPISLLIPCHRVIGSDGSLTGYAGGLDRKAKLLALEGASRFLR